MGLGATLRSVKDYPTCKIEVLKWVSATPKQSEPVFGVRCTALLCKYVGVNVPSTAASGLFELCYCGIIDTSQRRSKRRKCFVIAIDTLLCAVRGNPDISNKNDLCSEIGQWIYTNRYRAVEVGSSLHRARNIAAKSSCTLCLPEQPPKRRRSPCRTAGGDEFQECTRSQKEQCYMIGMWMEAHAPCSIV